jgi:anti-sigma factor RsiW
MIIHDNIDNFLAADLHGDLSEEERSALHTHLVECAACRKSHQETKIMNKILEENLAREKPDGAFEQRMLAGFRNRIPQQRGFIKSFANLMRLGPIQITAVVAVLLALVQIGRMITEETQAPRRFAGLPLAKDERGRVVVGERRDMAATSSFATGRANVKPAAPALAQAEDGLSAQPQAKSRAEPTQPGEADRTVVAGSLIPTPEESTARVPETLANRKLIRNATVDLEVASFDEALQKITGFANEEKGYVATTSSEKQENGKLKGEMVVKVLPANLDRFLQKIRGLGELKNQTLGTEDVTKEYFDTDARLKNAHVMEQRLIDMLKTKTGKVSDLLQVEKELGRVREEIEKMQGDLKFWDSQVQFATVTISLAEKDLEAAAQYLLKERAQLALYTPEVEKIYDDLKAIASPKIQITNAQLDRDNTGRVSARVSMLIAPEESDGVITNAKAMGRVENFQTQTERISQGGEEMSEKARTKRDKVELNITISRDEQEQAFQQTTLRILTSSVDEKSKQLRQLTEKQNGRVRSFGFSRDPDGREIANVSLRVPMKDYNALMQSLNSLGKVENISVQRQDRTGTQIDEANAPADISIQIYSQGNIVSSQRGLFATLRNTIAQGAGALMWSLRMIGVALAFLAPWVIAIVVIVWITKRIKRARRG